MRLIRGERLSAEQAEQCRINGRKGGRPPRGHWPKNKAVTEKALKYCQEAVETLAYEMRHCENPMIRVQCARELLDRGIGKPAHYADSHNGGPLMNQIVVYTGVPQRKPAPGEEEIIIGEEAERVFEIEGEVVDGREDS